MLLGTVDMSLRKTDVETYPHKAYHSLVVETIIYTSNYNVISVNDKRIRYRM